MNNRSTSTVKLDEALVHHGQNIVTKAASEILKQKKINLEMSVSDTDEANSSHKPPVVLLHMNSASQKVWQTIVGVLANNYRVITIDLLGHGNSTKICDLQNLTEDEKEILSADFYNPLAVVKELEAVLEKKKLHDVLMVGWYLGGNLGYSIAADNPSYVSKLITIGAPPIRFSQEGLKQGYQTWFTHELVPQWIAKPQKISHDDATQIAKNLNFENDTDLIHDLMTTDPGFRKHLFAKMPEYDSKFYDVLDAKTWVLNTNIPLNLIAAKKDLGCDALYIETFKDKLKNKNSEVSMVEETGAAFFKNKTNLTNNLHSFFSRSGDVKSLEREEVKPQLSF